MGRSLQGGSTAEPLDDVGQPEEILSASDEILARVIRLQNYRWPSCPNEDPIWGLLRIVMAQQISTNLACRLAERVKTTHPQLANPSPNEAPDVATLRELGLTARRAECCASIVRQSDRIRLDVQRGRTWEEALAGIKGIGPWTLAVFRIMVLREPDALPLGDVGLERAVAKAYGRRRNVQRLAEKWRPYRSVACWYLWRTLGNEQLG